ncbi:ATP-binding protein [Flavobacterium pedocola]
MSKYWLLITLFSFTAFSQEKAVKDSFEYYKEKRQYIKAFNFSDNKANYYLKKEDYPKFINQTLEKAKLLSQFIKDEKRAYKLILNTLNKTENKASEYNRVKLSEYLARINLRLKKYPQAIDVSKKALKIAYASKNDTIVAKLNDIMLLCYLSNGKTDSAFKHLEPALKSAQKINDNELIAKAYNTHFYFYSSIEERDIAKKYLDSSLVYALKSKSYSTITTAKANLGVHYLTIEKDYDKAIKTYLDLIESRKNNPVTIDYGSYYLNLAFAYEKLGNYKKAYDYQNHYVDFADSLIFNKNDIELEQIRTQYELDKAENTYKEKEMLLQQKQLKNEKMLYLLIAVLLFLGILFYFFYQNLKLRQKNKLKDVYQKTQQNIINATIDGQEEERKRLSGVLHDNISALLSSAGLHISAFEANYPDMKDELKKTKTILKEAHDKVRDLSHDLIPPVLEKLGLVTALEDLCEKNSNSLIDFEFTNFIERETRFQNDFEMKLYFIVAELFNNIIKHSNASKAFLTLDRSDNQISINIEDNGKGFEIKEGKAKEGLGLSQIKTRIKSLNGSISINSKEKSGTLIYIKVEIPREEQSNAVPQFYNA